MMYRGHVRFRSDDYQISLTNVTYLLAALIPIVSLMIWVLAGSGSTPTNGLMTEIHAELHKTVAADKKVVSQDGRELVFLLESGQVLHPREICFQGRNETPPKVMEKLFRLSDMLPDPAVIMNSNLKHSAHFAEAYGRSTDTMKALMQLKSREVGERARQYLEERIPDPQGSGTLSRLTLYFHYEAKYKSLKADIDKAAKSCSAVGTKVEACSAEYRAHLQKSLDRLQQEWETHANRAEVEFWRRQTSSVMNLEKRIENAKVILTLQEKWLRADSEEPFYEVGFVPPNWCEYLDYRVVEGQEQLLFYWEDQLRQQGEQMTKAEISEKAQRLLMQEVVASSESKMNQLREELHQLLKLKAELALKCKTHREDVHCHAYRETVNKIMELRHRYATEGSTNAIFKDKTEEPASKIKELKEPGPATVTGIFKDRARQTSSAKTEEDEDANVVPLDLIQQLKTGIKEVHMVADEHTNSHLSSVPRVSFKYTPKTPPTKAHDVIKPQWRISVPLGSPQTLKNIENLLNEHVGNIIVSATLMRVNITREWFDPSLFDTPVIFQEVPDGSFISPGLMLSPEALRSELSSHSYLLPLYPSALLLATDVRLTFPHLPDPSTLFSLAYQPRVSGGLGPFSFGPMFESSGRKINFKVEKTDGGAVIFLPGTQLVGYICSVVPRFPKL